MKYNLFFKNTLLALALLTGAVACDKDPIENPTPATSVQQPNPLPASALVKQQKWSENDHNTFTYNTKGEVIQMRSQWQYNLNNPTAIRSIDYNFEYDAQGKLAKMIYTGGFSVRYFYNNNDLIERAQEYYPGGAIQTDYQFVYQNGRISQVRRAVSIAPVEPPTKYREELFYDAKGNLNKTITSEDLGNGQFKRLETVEYTDFDDKVNPLHWLNRYPYLPQVRWQFNNPRRQTTTLADELPATVRTFAYTYDVQGRPISHSRTQNGTTLTATLAY
jgi:YD repeat-containing protein